MVDYLVARVRDLFPPDWGHLLGVAILAPILEAVRLHWAEFPLSNPVLCVTTVWAADFVAGSLVAWRACEWRPARARASVGKLVLWLVALAIAYEFRQSGAAGMGMAAGLVEAAILLSEGSSVFRNLAKLSPSSLQAKLLNRYADVTQNRSLKMPATKKEED